MNGNYKNVPKRRTVSDVYETMPRDVMFMLRYFDVDKERDVVWDPFPADTHGLTRTAAEEGYNVCETEFGSDALALMEPPTGATVIVSNPPFSRKVDIFGWLCDRMCLPFILLMPSPTLQRNYFSAFLREYASTWDFHVVIPNQWIGFHRNGEKLHLPIAGSMFLLARPYVEPQEPMPTERMPVTLELYDYKTHVADKEKNEQ